MSWLRRGWAEADGRQERVAWPGRQRTGWAGPLQVKIGADRRADRRRLGLDVGPAHCDVVERGDGDAPGVRVELPDAGGHAVDDHRGGRVAALVVHPGVVGSGHLTAPA